MIEPSSEAVAPPPDSYRVVQDVAFTEPTGDSSLALPTRAHARTLHTRFPQTVHGPNLSALPASQEGSGQK